MSAERKDSDSLGNRLLVIVAVITLGAGAAAWHFHTQFEATKADYNRAVTNYNSMARGEESLARTARQLLEEERDRASRNTGDVSSFLIGSFQSAGFPSERVIPRNDNPSPIGTWKEYPYRVDIAKKDQTIPRSSLVAVLMDITQQRPDLKTRQIDLRLENGEISSGFLQLSRFERAEPK